MPEYRRNRVAGGSSFFTLALVDRRSDLLVREIAALRAAVREIGRIRRFGGRLRGGWYPVDWAGGDEDGGGFGERDAGGERG